MKKLYDKNELGFALLWIGMYVVLLSVSDGLSARVGVEKSVTAAAAFALMMWAYIWVLRNGLWEHYGFCRLRRSMRDYLYFIPLLVIVSVNLWWGAEFRYTVPETCLFVFSMLCVGFLEELIFRGFLFRALCRDNLKRAFIISSVTFGIGHIVNLLNGAALLPTLLQICYATAVGFLFTYIFYTSGSLWPCIFTHSALNALSCFGSEGADTTANNLMGAAALIGGSVLYGLWLVKRIPLAAVEDE